MAGTRGTDGTRGNDKPVPTRMEPPVGADSAPFWAATRESVLLVQWCTDCDRGIFYPRSFCPMCGSSGSGLEWRTASGRGTVYAATTENNPAATGVTFSNGEPYVVALVDLEEGVRMMTNVVGCPQTPQALQLDMPLEVVFTKFSDEISLPLFQPAKG